MAACDRQPDGIAAGTADPAPSRKNYGRMKDLAAYAAYLALTAVFGYCRLSSAYLARASLDSRVVRLLEHPGAPVRRGEAILELDTNQLRLALERLEQQIGLKRNEVEKARLGRSAVQRAKEASDDPESLLRLPLRESR